MFRFKTHSQGKLAFLGPLATRIGSAVLLLLFAHVLQAQPGPGSIEIGGGGGRNFGGSFARGSNNFFDRRVDVDDDILRGLWIGAHFTRDWSVEVEVRRTTTQLIEPRGGVFPTEPTLAGLDLATVELAGVRSFRIGSFAPYLLFGAGVGNLDINVPDRAVRDTNRATLCAAGGARYYAARWIGVRIDVRGRATYLGKRSLGEDRGTFDSGRWLTGVELEGGVFVSFGRK